MARKGNYILHIDADSALAARQCAERDGHRVIRVQRANRLTLWPWRAYDVTVERKENVKDA